MDHRRGESNRIIKIVKRIGYTGAVTTRVDHSRMYICINVGLIPLAFSLLIVGPVPESTLDYTPFWTQVALAVGILVGSSICLFGIIRGTKLYKPEGDIRVSYAIAKWGILSNAFAMAFYVVSVVFNQGQFWASTLTTMLGGAICIGMLWVGLDFEIETDKLDKKFKAVIENPGDE